MKSCFTLALHLAMLAVTVPCVAESAAKGSALPPLSLDSGFAGDGTLELQIAVNDYAWVGLFDGSGGALLFGQSEPANSSNREGIMQQIASDGSIGVLSRYPAQEFGCDVPRAFSDAIRLSGGEYLAGGYRQTSCGGIPRVFSSLQLQSSGTIIQTFDEVPFSNQLAYIRGQAEQADGRIIAAGLVSGSGSDTSTFDFGVARFLANGALDTSFGTGGTFRWDLANDRDDASDVVIDSLGRILVLGVATSSSGDLDLAVLALDANGALDGSFGNAGVFIYDRAGFVDRGTEMAVLPSGRV